MSISIPLACSITLREMLIAPTRSSTDLLTTVLSVSVTSMQKPELPVTSPRFVDCALAHDDHRAGCTSGVDDAVTAAERSTSVRIVCSVCTSWRRSSGCWRVRISSVVGTTDSVV
ncbi:hypothetical protein ACT89R_31240 (plasmid) [Rhodococcus qingshengii]